MTDFAALAAQLVGFDWDRGNAEKSWASHGVSRAEAEEVFFNRPVLLAEDAKRSTRERRYNLLGLSNGGRLLSVIFTVRQKLVRVIPVRPMSRKERTHYPKVPFEAP
ncbi:BrnT family toxin [Gemmatimonas sp.]|uniref:BrnT family toxin n=1 Tax=Gemmatimonas sp. TaxID=1962908 RepID=UPI003342969D